MLTVTKEFEFDFAHKLPKYEGKCAQEHGHRGKLRVTIKGAGAMHHRRRPYKGILVDFSLLGELVNDQVIEVFDHRNMNELIKIPTAENFVQVVADKLYEVLGNDLVSLRFYETPSCWVDLDLREGWQGSNL